MTSGKRRIGIIIMLIALLAGIIIPACSPMIRSVAQAAESKYTVVLEDLKSDKKFKESDYPKRSGDHSLQVMQIAESVNGELFVYVYQPSGKCTATSINLSTTENGNHTYKNYKLTELNRQSVFGKYLVSGFEVSENTARYYNISSIYREWNAEIDNPATGATQNGNTISEVAYPVGKQYIASMRNGKTEYTCTVIETIAITEKYCGFVRYIDGFFLLTSKCESWYVAFDTDRPIDQLIEADIYYVTQKYRDEYTLIGSKRRLEEGIDHYKTLSYTEKAANRPSGIEGIFLPTYTWNRIESVADFQSKENLTDEAKENIKDKKWVLRFEETELYQYPGIGAMSPYDLGTQVSDVTILRLKFWTEGVVYNLGVVDNKQTAGQNPDNINGVQSGWETFLGFLKKIPWWGWVIIGVVVILLLCMVKPVFELVVFLLKGVVWIVTLPFRAIGAVFKNIGDHREKSKRKKAKKIKKSEEIHEEEGS